jgi:hypothetical protein
MRPVLQVCAIAGIVTLPDMAGCGLVRIPAEPDAVPIDGPPPDAAVPDAEPIPDASPPPDAPPCRFDLDLTAVAKELEGDTVDYQGVLLYGSRVSLYPGLGLGIIGAGPSDRYVDGLEEVTINFAAPPGAANIFYTVAEATDADDDTVRGMHELRAFYFPSGQDARYVDGEGRFDVDAIFPTLDRARRLTILARQDGVRISRIEYSVCQPPPTTRSASRIERR